MQGQQLLSFTLYPYCITSLTVPNCLFCCNYVLCCVQELAAAEAKAQQGIGKLGPITKGCAYQAWMGFYNSYKKFLRWSPEQLVQQANYFSRTLGEFCKYSNSTL